MWQPVVSRQLSYCVKPAGHSVISSVRTLDYTTYPAVSVTEVLKAAATVASMTVSINPRAGQPLGLVHVHSQALP